MGRKTKDAKMLNKQPKDVNVRLRDSGVLVFWQSHEHIIIQAPEKAILACSEN